MNEQLFERRVRAWLDAGPYDAPLGAVQSVLVAIETMPQVRSPLIARWRRKRPVARVGLLAAAATVVVAVGVAVAVLLGAVPDVAAPRLESPAELHRHYPTSSLRLEYSVGPADRRISDDETTTRTDVGKWMLTGPYAVAISCLGPGMLEWQAVTPPGLDPKVHGMDFGGNAPCDGRTQHALHLEQGMRVATGWQQFLVDVAAGASWRFALVEYPAALRTPPAFSPVAATNGWNELVGAGPKLVLGETRLAVKAPAGATRVALLLQCEGEGLSFEATLITSSARRDRLGSTNVDCDPSNNTADGAQRVKRYEYQIEGGTTVDWRFSNTVPVWVSAFVEVDGSLTTTYPAAPPLPADVAATSFAEAYATFDGTDSLLALGTIGSNRQVLLPVTAWGRTGTGGGDFVPLVTDGVGDAPARVDVYSVSRGASVASVGVNAGEYITDTWVNGPSNTLIFEVTVGGDGPEPTQLEYRAVALDGSTDVRVLVPVSPTAVWREAELALDSSIFVVDTCEKSGPCTRHIVELVGGDVRVIELDGRRTCEIIGIANGLVIARTSTGECWDDGGWSTVSAMPVDGGTWRTVAERPDYGVVTWTTSGPQFVFIGPDASGVEAFQVLDVRSGEIRIIEGGPTTDDRRGALRRDVRLPGGWVLVANRLGDFPITTGGLFGGFGDHAPDDQIDLGGRPPVLVNVETGEVIELVNLPGGS